MAGFTDILGALIKQGMSGSGGSRMTNAMGAGSSSGGLGDLMGSLTQMMGGGGSSSAKGAVGGGGLAMLASLAFSALKKIGQAPAQTPRALLEPQNAQEQQALEDDAEVIVKAMINAAKADGQIDQKEINKIIGKLDDDGLRQKEKDFFISEAKKPLNLAGVVASAGNQPEMAAEIYAASLLAIEVDTQAEKNYMEQLASGLELHPEVVSHIERKLGMQA